MTVCANATSNRLSAKGVEFASPLVTSIIFAEHSD